MVKFKRKVVAVATAITMAGSLFYGVGNLFPAGVAIAATDSASSYENSNGVGFTDMDFSGLTDYDWDWDDKVKLEDYGPNGMDVKVGTNCTVSFKVVIDSDAYNSLSDTNNIKVDVSIKTGTLDSDEWNYKNANTWPLLDKSSFTAEGDNYVAEVSYSLSDVEDKNLRCVCVEVVGIGVKGKINATDIKVAQKETATAQETLVYENAAGVTVDMDFSDCTDYKWDWDDKLKLEDYAPNGMDVKAGEKAKVTLKLVLDSEAYNSMSETNNIKADVSVKAGSLTDDNDWNYAGAGSWPLYDQSAFTADGNGNYVAEVSYTISGIVDNNLRCVCVEVVGIGVKGKISATDIKVYKVTEGEKQLEAMEPTVLSDLSTEENYKLWSSEGGYDYYHGGTVNAGPVISYDSENQRLKVTVDYSANAKSTWSEAKVNFTPAEAVDISNYNQLSVDFIYPDSLDGTKMKFFSNAGINKDTTIDESTAVDLGNGMKKVTVTMGFSPSDTPLDSITIGIIGYQTSFQGDVYLDNLVLSQNDPSADFVKITSTPGDGATADISNAATSVKFTDANLADCAKALYAYLLGLADSDQVLFGHQNDVSRFVTGGELGDVYDVTGSVSGIFGIDSMALTGSEAGGTDSASALKNSVEYSLKAAENGAIVTLSTHMPNFTNSKIVKNADGTYDFYQCNFDESKDLSNDSVKQILPGGEYNEVFKAYLDVIADYALQLQAENVPVIFRPFHENTGSWFWWGSTNAIETYKSLYRYTRDYLESRGVHNMLYVYSPNGPLTSEDEYLTRYPGDEYVDIFAFDYYDDYNTYPATSDGSFFENLDKTCAIVSSLAAKRGKIAAISETGSRVMKADGSDNEGLLVKENPVSEEATGVNWYQKVSDIAKKNNMPYWLIWANFSDTNFYVPYKYNDSLGQEMINEFIDFYNDESSIFGNGTNFYNNIDTIVGNITKEAVYDNEAGYMTYPFDMDTILSATTIKAWVKNAEKVEFVVANPETGKQVTLIGVASDNNQASTVAKVASATGAREYTAQLTQEMMTELGKTDLATITLIADGTVIAKLENISLGKEKDKAPANVLENFDFYSGSDGLLDVTFTENSAAGCSSEFLLDATNKVDGTYGGAFHYVLRTTGSEVWTGRVKSNLTNNDFSEYNAIQMWVKPDGKGQKHVVQLTDGSGEEFEVYLTDFVKGTEAQYVTIPFSSFKGKNNGTLDTSNITKFAIWCNSIVPEGYTGEWVVDSTIYFDRIEAITISAEDLAKVDKNGLIITATSLVDEVPPLGDSTDVLPFIILGASSVAAFIVLRKKEYFKNCQPEK